MTNTINYITRPELAELLRLSIYTLETFRFRRNGPPYYRIGGVSGVRYLRSEVEAWIASRRAEV